MRLFFFLWILMLGQDRSVRLPVARYINKYQTTAHQLLGLEEQYSNKSMSEKATFYDHMYRKLDELIDTVSGRVTPYVAGHPVIDKAAATTILSIIDSVLTEQYFLVCIQMDKLSDGLTPRGLDHLPCAPFAHGYRADFVRQHKASSFYAIDCDLGAFLYLSLGEVLHFPIRFIEVPGHNFVRWEFGPGDYINWDNNSAGVYTDDDFRNGRTPTESKGFTKQEEVRNHFLEPLSDSAILGYYLSIVAIYLSHQDRYLETEQLYQRSIALRPYDALASNNLAWMYVTVPQFNNKEKYRKAYQLSVKVDSLLPSEIEYRDTYSCTCAAVGLFKKATDVEKTARNKATRLEGYKHKRTCLDLGETIW